MLENDSSFVNVMLFIHVLFSHFPLHSVPVIFFCFSSVPQCSCQRSHVSQGHQGSARQHNSTLMLSSILSRHLFLLSSQKTLKYSHQTIVRQCSMGRLAHSYRTALLRFGLGFLSILSHGPILSPSQKPLVPSKAGFLSYQIKVQAWGSLLSMNQTRTLKAPAMAHGTPMFASTVREHAE